MARSRSPWRALRPVLLAGAATLTWLSFSSTAASADTLSDSSSLLGGVTSSVSSASDKLLSPAPLVPAPGQPSGLMQPVIRPVSNTADDVIASVPVINRVVPGGTVATITVPIAQLADGTTSAVVETVVPPATEAVPVLEPVLNPVTDLVTGKTPIRVPDLPGLVGDDEGLPGGPGSASAGSTTTDASSTAETADTVQGSGPVPVSAVEASSLDALAAEAQFQFSDKRPGGNGLVASSAFSLAGSVALSVTGESPGSVDPAPFPGPVPAAPGVSGTGSGASSATGGSGSAAWLNPFDLHLPPVASSRAGELSEHAPAPVSFDPGSSPD